jgi:hypothetical protein
MDIKELNKLYYMKKNIKELEEELAEINNLGSAPLNDMPKADGKVSNPTELFVLRKNRILEKLNKKYETYLTEYEKINNFIDVIDDEEVKLIARLRFIKQKNWFDIAEEISPEDRITHWTTPRKKLNRYLESKKENEITN